MPPKKKMTDEERRLMVEQMDRDLEEFILQKLEANKDQPREPFDFAKMEKELINHPAFMTEWDPTKPMTPELEAIINLKYEQCDDLVEKATNYKEDGNHNFKIGKYRWAIDNYTVAIQCKCPDKLLNAICYTNRAAAHFRLGNYGNSFKDVVFARKFVPDHMKAIVRGVQCCLKLSRFQIAQRWINDGGLIEPDHKEILKLSEQCDSQKRIYDRDRRKELAKERKEEQKRKALLDAIKARNICLRGVTGEEHDPDENVGDEWESLYGRTANSEAKSARVFLDDHGTLHWPLLLLYPEYGQTDLISQANETTRLVDLLYQVFGPDTPPADWDADRKYKLHDLKVYFEDRRADSLYEIDMEASIQALLSHDKYVVYGGLPSLIVLVNGSKFASEFLQKYSLK